MQFSLQNARRIALAAQGFDRARPRRVTVAQIGEVIRRLGLLQLDFVNVLVPSHYLVLFSRLGPYRRMLLDEAVYLRREFTEQWAHEASIVPMEHWPLLRHRRETHRVRPWGFEKLLKKHAPYVEWTLAQIRERGPLRADELREPEGAPRRINDEYGWGLSVRRHVLEAHFGTGRLAVAVRLRGFARTYDLAERVIPAAHHSLNISHEEAQRTLLEQAARAQGVATLADLADYYRMTPKVARPRIAELVEEGKLKEVRVEGWREPAYLHPDAKPRPITAAALLSSFDPVVWFRKRALRLFGFDYRLEVFVPAKKRKWGFYVLPFLMGDQLVARVDLKADREKRRLLVQAAYLESHAKSGLVAEALVAELRTLAGWLELESVKVAKRGNLARALAGIL